jgi:type II secretory pathway component GspD/PulD (secretin)
MVFRVTILIMPFQKTYNYVFLAFLFLMSPVGSFAGSSANAGDELISLTAENEPLGNVFNKISVATGYEIVLDHDWRNYPVSVALEKVPLHQGLKRILKDLNNVIVYVSRKKIKIIIYDKISHDAGPSAPPIQRTPVSQQPSYHPPAPGISDSQTLERAETPTDDSSVSGEESETGAPENEARKTQETEKIKPN